MIKRINTLKRTGRFTVLTCGGGADGDFADLRAPGSSRPTKVYRIPAGTEIKILEIRAENTITHGIERRAIAIDTGRQHCPSRMSLPANRSENPSLVR